MPSARSRPDPDAHRQQWSKLDFSTRRRIVRAVNRGRALDDPREAALAVRVARNQQRFWRWAWLIGPVAAMLLQRRSGWVAMAWNAAVAGVLFAVMAWLFHRRAQRAEAANRAVTDRTRTARRHLPRSKHRRRSKRRP
ncbi:MAG: hypothetical protein M3N57_11390 [Actinomycetota bacterium]|nr:hypothetical protein [Actinomycetota bacterium]